jgi:hypothetical protein
MLFTVEQKKKGKHETVSMEWESTLNCVDIIQLTAKGRYAITDSSSLIKSWSKVRTPATT